MFKSNKQPKRKKLKSEQIKKKTLAVSNISLLIFFLLFLLFSILEIQPNFLFRIVRPTFIIEVGVTLSVELLTPEEEFCVVVVVVAACCDDSVSIGVDVSDRWLLLLLLLSVLSEE